MRVEELVVSHASWIRDMSRFYCRNVAEAEDLAGETIFRCLRGSESFDDSRSFKPWVKTIMERLYITQYNRAKKILFRTYAEHYDEIKGAHADQLAKLRNLLSIVRDCGRKSCTIECVMLYAKGYSYEEISSRVSIPVGTVKSRVSMGRKILRKAFGESKCQ